MKTPKRATGDRGESIAVEYFLKRGFIVLDRNYQKPWGEIDVVAKKGSELHFIEVKTQSVNSSVSTFDFYEAEERVDYYKRNKLRRIIETYLLEKRLTDCDYCVDVLAIYLNKQSGEVVRIEYLEDIML
jgi:putative endonuclease